MLGEIIFYDSHAFSREIIVSSYVINIVFSLVLSGWNMVVQIDDALMIPAAGYIISTSQKITQNRSQLE